jgi:ABC-type molybdate transport system, periplasmic component
MNIVHILSGGAAFGLVDGIRKDFEAKHGCRIEGMFGAVGAMRDKLLAGDPCDAAILSRKLIDGLAADGKVRGNTVRDLGVVSTGVAVKAGRPPADVSSEHGLREALLAAGAVYVPDMQQSTAGQHMKAVFEKLGVFEQIRARVREFPNGATAMKALAAAAEPDGLGCTQVTEILYTPGVTLVGELPEGCALDTVYTIAVAAGAAQPELAGKLVEALASPGLSEFKRANGIKA